MNYFYSKIYFYFYPFLINVLLKSKSGIDFIKNDSVDWEKVVSHYAYGI